MTTAPPVADGAARDPQRVGPRRNWPLLLIAAFMAPVAVQAALLPRSFFDGFPVGRGWIVATGGAYNEHLARDVGVLFVSLIVATAWAATTRAGDRAVAAAWIVQGVAHLAFHAAHLHDLHGLDRVALLVSLAAVPVLGAVALRVPAVGPARG